MKRLSLAALVAVLAAALLAGCNKGGATTGQFAPNAQPEMGANGKPLGAAPSNK